MQRRPNFQTIAWFNDLRQRHTLDMDPPYQRRSVWTQSFKDYFIETILLGLPSPAIFLYEDISPTGTTVQHVVDGKQRLTAIFEFIDERYPVADDSRLEQWRGWYFSSLPDGAKKEFWSYILLVEYVPSEDEATITSIFDRINRNTAKLTPQELRHAKFSGEFITTAEAMANWMEATLGRNFPRIVQSSRNQMKDVEMVSLLLLLTEEGVRSYSQDDLDQAYASRDDAWEQKVAVEEEFRAVITMIRDGITACDGIFDLEMSRLRNQADFYSLYGALLDVKRAGGPVGAADVCQRLTAFVRRLAEEESSPTTPELKAYLDAARSASNDKGPRDTRISILKKVLSGEFS